MAEALSGSGDLPTASQVPDPGVGSGLNPPITPQGIEAGGRGDRSLERTPAAISEKKVFPARRQVRKPRLKPTQEAFIRHYTDPNSPAFGNGTESYARAHPTCESRGAAEVGAVRTLGSAKVQEIISENWGLGRLKAEMERNVNACWDSQKYGDHREGVKVLAQLSGEWKEKSEVTHLEDAQKEAIRREVSKALGSN